MPIRMSAAEAKKLGLKVSPRKSSRRSSRQHPLGMKSKFGQKSHSIFFAALAAHGITEKCEPEFEFVKGRKWRFDYAFPAARLALEIQGGNFAGGRHVNAASLLDEYEKLNAAACLGWRVLFFLPDEVNQGSVFATIKSAFGGFQNMDPFN